jgi:serine/threonine protein kinase
MLLHFQQTITSSTKSDELIESIRIDAMSMERLSNSDRILDIYGHCGVSVSVTYMNGPPLSKLIETKDALSPQNKLQIAFAMAKSLADLHGHNGGPIVHGDVQYVQWLLDEYHNVVLCDLNRAEPIFWDEEAEEYCKYSVGAANGNVRSPEEFLMKPINEKIDVYSFGLVLYTILTTKEPYWDDGITDVKGQVLIGEKPIVDEQIRENSDPERIIASVMDECLEFNPDERIDIFKVVSLFQESIDSILDGSTGKLSIGDWNDADHDAPNRYYYDEYDEQYDKNEAEYEAEYEDEPGYEYDNDHEDKFSKKNHSNDQDLNENKISVHQELRRRRR